MFVSRIAIMNLMATASALQIFFLPYPLIKLIIPS